MGCGCSTALEEKEKKYKPKIQPIVQQREQYKKVSVKGITILDNVQKYFPESITREEIKEMVCEALKIGDLKNRSKGILTDEKIEAIIDLLVKSVSNENNQDLEDKRLDDIKAMIGFYDINKENIKKLFFKNQKPKDEEIEEKINELDSMSEDAKLFAIELENV